MLIEGLMSCQIGLGAYCGLRAGDGVDSECKRDTQIDQRWA